MRNWISYTTKLKWLFKLIESLQKNKGLRLEDTSRASKFFTHYSIVKYPVVHHSIIHYSLFRCKDIILSATGSNVVTWWEIGNITIEGLAGTIGMKPTGRPSFPSFVFFKSV